MQAPVEGSHMPATWQESLAGQFTVLVPVQTPLMQADVDAHRFGLFTHVVPLGAAGLLHWPELGSHVPATWQESLGAHTTGFEPLQAPLWQTYAWLHGLVPPHVVPSVAAGFEHCPLVGSHIPAT